MCVLHAWPICLLDFVCVVAGGINIGMDGGGVVSLKKENIKTFVKWASKSNNDKIKKDYSFIKDKKFKSQLQHFVEELHSGIGLIF